MRTPTNVCRQYNNAERVSGLSARGFFAACGRRIRKAELVSGPGLGDEGDVIWNLYLVASASRMAMTNCGTTRGPAEVTSGPSLSTELPV